MSKTHRRFAYQGAGSGTQQHCHLSTGIRVFGFPLFSERASVLFSFFIRSFAVFRIPTTKQRQPQARSHTLSISSPHCDWIRGGILDCIFGRGRNCRNIGWPFLVFLFFGLCSLFSLLRLTIRGTCSNALQPGKKGPGQNFWIPNSSSLFGISRRHKMALLDDTPIRDAEFAHHKRPASTTHNPLDLVFFYLFLMYDFTTLDDGLNHHLTSLEQTTISRTMTCARLEAGAHDFLRNETARTTQPV